MTTTDIAIIGAGPAGAVAAALLCKSGHRVTILEQSHFPRFSIGESLLPQCMEFIEQAGMLDAVTAANFQFKNGAAFARNGQSGSFDFSQKFTRGHSNTFQVERARFDHIIAECAEQAGADIRYGHKITDVSFTESGSSELAISSDQGAAYSLKAKFLLDASGFGRVLPRLLDLETPSDFPSRKSIFTHIKDNISDESYDRNKILIVIHPEYKDVCYWLIPFNNGRCSIGVVAKEEFFNASSLSEDELLKSAISASPDLCSLLQKAEYDTPVRMIKGYSCNVKSLWGKGYALLGNAGEFLDPVFSSGVTIAMKSATLAAPLVSKTLANQTVDWESQYALPLKIGVDTFRSYVSAWYEGSLQNIIFSKNHQPKTREMVCSILAGYAWDTENPFVEKPDRRLKALAQICRA